MTQTAILKIDQIEAVYNLGIIALRGVSLSVEPGEIVALLGANGAGKTTTLMAASNLLAAERGKIERGDILFEGKSTKDLTAADLVERGLVQVLEGRHCFPALTVEENLLTGALSRRISRSELSRDLDRIYAAFPKLSALRNNLAGLTSGGEQQMTAIGRALMAKPKLLILDEPSMGLAPIIVEEIFKLLKSLNKNENLSLLVAEQNSNIALRYADRAYVLENGKVALNGKTAELRQRDDIKAFYLGHDTHVGPSATA
ncbi:ABC transporter ATP-binding protein [Hyphomicrobium methylovorum]|uniref:ABC transporter ATP-binding protein n=1 Tax=Hyphomicrobium methylovorum TaxID=84 RepID=UPI0015E7BE32|nr:ABC transporter ATP-binding protein [Hyphomicrobium methylovorum]MBA2126988.1 ABC transporter ATP-binding protein [Hyphomicrobium methylovorum]